MSSLNEFEILKRLGEGSFGSVYQVKRKSDGKIYAMKKVKMLSLSTKEKENALNEVRILASIKSPNIISYKDSFYDESSSCLCIIMDFAQKGDVLMQINEKKKNKQFFEEATIWKYAADMLLGLKALHDMKILHRDLKGANIFIAENGSLKLGDLNVSKVQKKDYAYTQTGTPYYTSPEVWQNRPYDSKCDVWSLGCVLYEVTTLDPPFKATSMEDLYKKVLRGVFPPINLQRYSSDLQKFLESCLKTDPKMRSSVDALITNKHIMPFVDIDALAANDIKRDLKKKGSESQPDLLQTIKLPFGNLKGLNNRMPKPNYEPEEAKSDQITTKKTNERPNSASESVQKLATQPGAVANNNPIVSKQRDLSLNKNNNNVVLNNYPMYSPNNQQRQNSAQPIVKRVLSQNDLNPPAYNYVNNGGKNYMPQIPGQNNRSNSRDNSGNYHYQSPQYNQPKISVVSEKETNYSQNQRQRSNSRDAANIYLENYRNQQNNQRPPSGNYNNPYLPQSPSSNKKLAPLPPKPQNSPQQLPAGMPSQNGLPPRPGRYGY